jgi:hypothetical protein
MTTWLDTHSADATQRRHLLYEIDFATIVRWTDCPLSIAWDGHMWAPKTTASSGITTRQLDGPGATIQVGNADNFMSALFFSGGAKDKIVKVWVACFDITSNSQIPQQVYGPIFRGKIDTLVITNSGTSVVATITLGPPVEQMTKILPTRKMSDILRA